MVFRQQTSNSGYQIFCPFSVTLQNQKKTSLPPGQGFYQSLTNEQTMSFQWVVLCVTITLNLICKIGPVTL